MNVPDRRAECTAAAILGAMRTILIDRLGFHHAARIDTAIPELERWTEDSGVHSTGVQVASMLRQAAQTRGVAMTQAPDEAPDPIALQLEALDISRSQSRIAAPLLLRFIEARLPSDLVREARASVPFLTMAPIHRE